MYVLDREPDQTAGVEIGLDGVMGYSAPAQSVQ